MLTGTATGKTYCAQPLSAQAEPERNWPCCTATDAQKTMPRVNIRVYVDRCTLVYRTCVYNPEFFLLPPENLKSLTKKKGFLRLEPSKLKINK